MSEQQKPETVIGSPEHAQAMRDWERNMRLQPTFEHDRKFEIGRTKPDIIMGPKGDEDADVGFQGPQAK
jgi:hypothetical protein